MNRQRLAAAAGLVLAAAVAVGVVALPASAGGSHCPEGEHKEYVDGEKVCVPDVTTPPTSEQPTTTSTTEQETTTTTEAPTSTTVPESPPAEIVVITPTPDPVAPAAATAVPVPAETLPYTG